MLAVEPYLITLSKDSDVFPIFQHEGVEFLYMLEGEVGYRHGDKTYLLQPGDSLYFDADVPHGPEELASCRHATCRSFATPAAGIAA